MGRRKMKAYGEKEHGGKYILDDYIFSHNHTKAVRIRSWKRHLKNKARQNSRRELQKALDNPSAED